MFLFFHNFSASSLIDDIDDSGEYPDYYRDYPSDYPDYDPPKDCYLESPNTPMMRIFSCVPPQPQIPKCCKNTEIIDTR